MKTYMLAGREFIEYPPQRRTILCFQRATVVKQLVTFPYMLFSIQFDYNGNKWLQAFFANKSMENMEIENIDEYENRIYSLPMSNVEHSPGAICMGEDAKFNNLTEAISIFWQTIFSAPVYYEDAFWSDREGREWKDATPETVTKIDWSKSMLNITIDNEVNSLDCPVRCGD